jgi:hypothetical protein
LKGISNSKAFGPTWTNEKDFYARDGGWGESAIKCYYFGFNKNFYIMDSHVKKEKLLLYTFLLIHFK